MFHSSKRNSKFLFWSPELYTNSACLAICVLFFCVAQAREDTPPKIEQPIIATQPVVDEIELKQQEMRDTIVLVQTRKGRGSGVVIDCLETDTEDMFEYRVLTSAHVIRSRFITYLRGVDSLTGRIKTETLDTGCSIITFNHVDRDWNQYNTNVIAEDNQYDLALLSFISSQELAIAQIANDEMLAQVRVFDEITAIGCQLGNAPIPTVGIVSQVLIGSNGEKYYQIYGSTAQISPGSSGGGLFREYNGHYYLIGTPYGVAVAPNGQFIPHLAYAMSVASARDFIDLNSVSYLDE